MVNKMCENIGKENQKGVISPIVIQEEEIQ
ncbi:hypothetical protein ES702_01793 [subsurface metagenome]